MSIVETLKNAGKIVIEAAKANPVAAAAVVVGTGAVIGGGVWWNKRSKAKKVEAATPAVAGSVAEAVVETAKPVLAVVDGQSTKTA